VACMATSAAAPAPKAALMVIGNEVLSGSITDTNTPWLAKLLYRYASAHPCTRCHTYLLQHIACSTVTLATLGTGQHPALPWRLSSTGPPCNHACMPPVPAAA
jgi:hypothetical protein